MTVDIKMDSDNSNVSDNEGSDPEAGKFVRSIRMEDGNDNEIEENVEPAVLKKKKRGIVYISNIPKHLNVTMIREILGQYGKIGRVYLQPEKETYEDKLKYKKKKRKHFTRHFTEGWVEFESKRAAIFIASELNTKSISDKKGSRFYDTFWSLKYLPRFKWTHLSERLAYEKAVYRQRLKAEVSQARKEAAFFQANLDKSEKKKKKTKVNE